MIRVLLAVVLLTGAASAQQQASVVVFCHDGFPSSDTSAVVCGRLAATFPGASPVAADVLPSALLHTETLVLPYGSAFPEAAWPAILDFLQRGGNLVAIGGRPFTRPAFKDANGAWKLREENYAFARALNLIDYQETEPSSGLKLVSKDEVLKIEPFAWSKAWSLVVRLSDHDTSSREGAAGRIDARLTPLAWGERDGHKIAAPVVQIDHLHGNFAGGRWVLVPTEVGPEVWTSARAGALLDRAAEGASDFRVQIASPLLLPDEPIVLTATWQGFGAPPPAATLDIVVRPEHGESAHREVQLNASEWPVRQRVELPASSGTGFHTVTATLRAGPRTEVSRTGFWMRDLQYLRSGPKLTVDRDFFQLDGRPLPVVGTTYMASDAQRLFFSEPNPYVWDCDMEQIAGAGLNMLRTGWWSGWDDLVGNGVATEHSLRTMEAFLMTARRHNLPVQWTLFAFMPEVLGGGNPYLNPEAVRRESAFVNSVVARFKDVPFLAWDLINEPSFDNPERFWSTRPNGDAVERSAWNEWLRARYGDDGERNSSWRLLPQSDAAPLPGNRDFAERAAYIGGHPVAAFDFQLFAQEQFAAWAVTMRDAIRGTGSAQLVTVGQDEGGGTDRPSPSFYSPALDFTTTHTWWLNDALLWDSLVAKAPGKPMLTQETGFQREWGLDGRPRRDTASEASILERKIAVALATGTGAIQWLWNVNAWMTSEQEVTIGAVRPDGTEKPEVEVMRKFAKFASVARDHFKDPELPDVAIVTSQALQYSVLGNAAIEAQQRAVRVLSVDLHAPACVVTENKVASLGRPKLVIVPAPQALSEAAWQKLIAYVQGGGKMLITGSPERDDRWRRTRRLRDLGIEAVAEPLTFRAGEMTLGDRKIVVQFAGPRQLTLESLRMANGWAEKQVGKGTLFIAAYPVELAEAPDATASIYSFALDRAGVRPPYEGASPGVLVRPVVFADSILYLLLSESGTDQDVDIRDRVSGGRLRLRLGSQRAALLLLDRKTGAVLAKSD